MRSTSSTLLGLLGCACLALRNVDGLGVKATFYADTNCSETKIWAEVTDFGATHVINGSSHLLYENFGECYVDVSGFGNIRTCDPTTGDIVYEVYSDAECTDLVSSFRPPSVNACVTYDCEGTAFEEGCSIMTICVADDAPAKIERQPFNYIGVQYSDDNCTDATGSTEVISFAMYGYDENCAGTSGNDALSECGEDTQRAQILDSYDSTCSGDVWAETVSYSLELEADAMLCLPTAIEGFHYGLTECTTAPATVGDGFVPTTPAPSVSTSGSSTDTTSNTSMTDTTPTTPAPSVSTSGSSTDTTSNTPMTDTPPTTPAPSVSTSGSSTDTTSNTPTTETPAPAAESEEQSTPSPESGSRGAVVTVSPTSGEATTDGNTPSPVAVVDSGTIAPTTTQGMTQENGATGARGMGIGAAIVTCAVAMLAMSGFGI